MFTGDNLANLLNTISQNMQTPVIAVLLFAIVLTVFIFGTLVAEFFTERRQLKEKLPEIVDKIKSGEYSMETIIEESRILVRQKKTLMEILNQKDLSERLREAMATRLMDVEQFRYRRRVKVTDVIARVAPMLGLLGTLIPLGPGIIALGRGDTLTLSLSLQVAFDTTIAGLLCAAVAYIISVVRSMWYNNYMSMLEAIMEYVLEEVNRRGQKV